MPKQIVSRGRRWYAIHTYSGYEEAVERGLRQRIESLALEDKIFNVLVPTEKKIKIKNGKRRVVTEKIFPGYVFVDMTVTDDSWYVVRNTPHVTGFIGTGTIPTPIAEEEMKSLQKRHITRLTPPLPLPRAPRLPQPGAIRKHDAARTRGRALLQRRVDGADAHCDEPRAAYRLGQDPELPVLLRR